MPRFNMVSKVRLTAADATTTDRIAPTVTPRPRRSLLLSVLKAPALRPARLTSSFCEAGCAAPLDRRRWCDLPFRLRTNRTSRGSVDRGRWDSTLHLNGCRTAPFAAGPELRVRLVHGLGGPRRGPSARSARPPGRLGAPLLPPGAGDDGALEARHGRGLRRPRPPGGVDRRRPRRDVRALGGPAPGRHPARSDATPGRRRPRRRPAR